MFMITAAIQSFCEMVKSFLGLKQTDIEHKPTLEVVKDKKSLKKGTDYAEKIIDITDKYEQFFSKSDLKKYKTLKTKFRKYN